MFPAGLCNNQTPEHFEMRSQPESKTGKKEHAVFEMSSEML